MSLERENYKRDESFRDSIATVDETGARNWIFPKKPKGSFYTQRSIVSIILLAILFLAPWIRIDGNPLIMLNVIERKFIIFGQIFWPQDFYLFFLAMIIGVLFIVLFTVIFGRIFCGWICPQTIFMEMVFRKIEYAIEGDWKQQKKLDKMSWNAEKIRKKTLKHSIFFLISFLISNTFLAYIIGSDELLAIQFDNPMNHFAGLSSLLIFTGVFYGVFAKFREQVCIAVCPYGRLQGVLLDRNSLVVAYDYVRGELRGKWKGKKDQRKEKKTGHCIDCNHCVDVCPTGIDIRNGTQLECINCTACIDACDSMMTNVGLPTGLIKYASEENIDKNEPFKLTVRIKAYIVVLSILVIAFVTLLLTRSDLEATFLRAPGILYQTQEDGRLSNLYNVKVINKTSESFPLEIRVLEPEGEIKMVGKSFAFDENGTAETAVFIITDRENLTGLKTSFEIGIYSNGKLIETVETNFLGPAN